MCTRGHAFEENREPEHALAKKAHTASRRDFVNLTAWTAAHQPSLQMAYGVRPHSIAASPDMFACN